MPLKPRGFCRLPTQIVQRVVDMSKMEEHKDAFGTPDAALMCLGTTRKDAGSADKFRCGGGEEYEVRRGEKFGCLG